MVDTKLIKTISCVQVRAAEDVAAHAPLLCGGEERPRAGGGAGEEGLAVQATGEKHLFFWTNVSEHQLLRSLHNKPIQSGQMWVNCVNSST